MKLIVTLACLTALALPHQAALAARAAQKTIVCPYLDADPLKIPAPAKLGDLPKIDFDYPAKATLFSFRDGNLLLVAMDEDDVSRVRIVISAQRNKAKGTYDGQILVDMGGNQIQLHNGPVSCKVEG